MRFYYLQFARFLAAVYVLFFHKFSSGFSAADFLISKGDSAVSFFFILSGFVITNSLLRNPVGFKEYIYRRSLKIMPLWILSVLFSIIASATFSLTPMRFFLAILLLQTVYPNYSLDINFVGWSLSVEFIMYIILFFMVTCVNVKSKGFAFYVILVWVLTQFVFLHLISINTVQLNTWFDFDFFIYYHPIWHLSSFLMGILSAVYVDQFKMPGLLRLQYSAFTVSIVYILMLAISFFAGYKIGLARFYHSGFFAPFTGLYLIVLSNLEKFKSNVNLKWQNQLFDILGNISFGIYLFHIPIYNVMNIFVVVGNNGWTFWVYFYTVLLFSYFAYKIFDEALHKLSKPVLERLSKSNPS